MIIRPYLRFASWLWRVVDRGIDQAYMGAAGALADMARSLWKGVDVRLIDRPASAFVNAADKMGTRVTKLFGGDATVALEVKYAAVRLVLILLVLCIFLLGLTEQIEIYFLG
jgi:hypothetical protein